MKFSTILLTILLTVGCTKSQTIKVTNTTSSNNERLSLVADKPVKNVILIIGDGTGLAQIASGQLAIVGKNGYLNLQRMPISGFVRTTSSNSLITDSAAGATAYSCGTKTNNGMIGYLPNGDHCKTLLELAEEKGLKTGMVVTSTMTHATPSSFAAHVKSRGSQNEIAEQYINSGVEVFFGGGREFFIPQSEEGSKRKDDKNLINDFENIGYEYVSTTEELKNSTGEKVLGLFALQGIPSIDRSPTTQEMTKIALSKLQNENGFFLMVEGSQIDWAGHENDAEYATREMRDFDNTIKTILDFAQEDGETLVVMTADHETGGMTMMNSKDDPNELRVEWVTDYHTGIPVPLMAYGPHAIQFAGWNENTDIGIKISELLELGEFPQIIPQ